MGCYSSLLIKGVVFLITKLAFRNCCWNVFPNYNQHDATFLDLFISTDALHF